MSMMYGKRRVVLRKSGLVVACGSDGPGRPRLTGDSTKLTNGGDYHPLGYWYEQGGLFYADLKSEDQWSVSRDTVANKGLGGLPTKQALREYVMEYWRSRNGGEL
jgi:hypothetical protein